MSQNYNCVAPEPFNFSNPGDWPKWIRRFERFRQASGLINNPENEQVNMLVYCMGDNADDILLSCKIASDQLENYGKVIECFESHFIPRRNIIYERARFNQRCQQEGEKVNEFITALHSLAEHCNFGMLHDELIRDRIVVGVRDRALSERMQLDTDLTLVKATLMAKQLESVKEQQSSLYQQDSVDQIKKMPNHIKETKRHEQKIRQFKSNQLGGSSHGCTRCGNSNNHDWKNCPAMNSYCSKCKKKGHYAKVCRSEAINEIKSEIAFLGSVEDNSKKWIVPIKVNNRQINFKIDTGADVNVLPLQYYYQSFQRIKLEKSDKILQGPNGIPLETVGMIHIKLQNKGQHLNSKIYIVDKLKQPLLSGETSEKLNIVRMIQQLSSNFLNPKREFPEIFNGLGHAKINYKISLQSDAKPYALCTPRRVPIPLMKQVKEQLEEMTRLGVIESVEEPTEWCAGMVAVSKPGGKIRICVDLTKLNQYIRRENYPLPATEHILGQLGNACYFSKLDANSGFWQFGLAKESQKLTTFITPFGRFFFKRIPFGITSAPEIFQRKMTQLLGKIEGVVCFMDDIVVYGSSLEEHNERVRQVLKKIQEEGMTLNPEKCQFGVKTVKFLGHTLSSEGLFIDEEKLDAITKMEAPRSTKELKSFLGMVNYLGKFIPNLADKLQPLNSLLSTKNEWVWDEPQKKSFNLLKQELVSRPNLALFDPSRTTIVSADASSFGLGGVLRQEQPDGSLKPIAYVSRTLSETEKRYSQIEKEGLAIVWTCDRLKDYVTGIKIHIETDHKPLIAIFTSKSLEDMTPRLQRLKMRMMRYSYQISHIAGKKQIVADMLSRKPMSKPHKDELEEELSAYIQSIEFPATEERLLEISRKQKEDSLCSQLAKYCMSGWPKNKREVDPALRGYWQFQEDLTYQNGLLLRGQRILIPKSLRKDILEKLHQGHFGINKCRSRAKESVWWLGISQESERMVSSCTKCLKERKPKHEPLMPSEFPIRPWQKVGMDLFYLNGRWYLIVCDYYSRYPEISLLQNLTAQEVISHLKSIFARHGTPETVRSDNGPQFQKVLGSEFSKFSKEWSFKHITSSPKFPQSNGFIEAIIKNIKQSFKKEEDCYLTLQAHRTMPLESCYSPAELLMGRRLRTSVPAIESSLMPRYLDSEALQEREKRRVINQKCLYDKRHDVHSLPPLQQGDSVWIRDQRVEGTVLHKSEEPRSYWVQTPQGKVRRNRLHLTPLPKMGSTMDASEDGQRQEQRNEETPTSTSTWLSRRCKDDQEQETEEDCPTPTASSTRDGRMQRDNQDQDPEKSLPSMPAVHTRYGRAVKIPRRGKPKSVFTKPRRIPARDSVADPKPSKRYCSQKNLKSEDTPAPTKKKCELNTLAWMGLIDPEDRGYLAGIHISVKNRRYASSSSSPKPSTTSTTKKGHQTKLGRRSISYSPSKMATLSRPVRVPSAKSGLGRRLHNSLPPRTNPLDLCKLSRKVLRSNKVTSSVLDDSFCSISSSSSSSEKALSRSRTFEWFSRFLKGREKVNDDQHTGRPRSLRCEENKFKIKELIKSNRRISIKDLSSETGLSVGLCHQIVTKDLDMIRTSSKFVPQILTEEQKEVRMDVCKNMVEMTRTYPEWMQKIITGDETWVYQYDPETKRQSSQWIERGEPKPKKARFTKSKVKTLLLHFLILMVWFTMNLFLSDVQLIKRFIWG
ncbi:K02A2.6-like [Cordylochernes scorpioides]|uniref:RNA-directed DNA polymerase n=1 Tax=Cordylochernes scorpioides TaxID=51811 RepID=A0ABY6K4J3_9ARAC|nr:K02A2.6-like [Cordylochernes scorpioides]